MRFKDFEFRIWVLGFGVWGSVAPADADAELGMTAAPTTWTEATSAASASRRLRGWRGTWPGGLWMWWITAAA